MDTTLNHTLLTIKNECTTSYYMMYCLGILCKQLCIWATLGSHTENGGFKMCCLLYRPGMNLDAKISG